MRQRVLIWIGIAGLILAAAAPSSAQNADQVPSTGGWVGCSDSGVIHITPGITLTPQPVRISFTLELFGCSSSDPTIHSGTVTAQASSPSMSCLGGQMTNGTATFSWSNGRSSRLTWSGAVAGVAVAHGTIIDGSEFVGDPFAGYVALAGADPSVLAPCGTPQGLTAAQFNGYDQIGLPLVSQTS
jgi:hypothetical protein